MSHLGKTAVVSKAPKDVDSVFGSIREANANINKAYDSLFCYSSYKREGYYEKWYRVKEYTW